MVDSPALSDAITPQAAGQSNAARKVGFQASKLGNKTFNVEDHHMLNFTNTSSTKTAEQPAMAKQTSGQTNATTEANRPATSSPAATSTSTKKVQK